jgi:hypothetical protein
MYVSDFSVLCFIVNVLFQIVFFRSVRSSIDMRIGLFILLLLLLNSNLDSTHHNGEVTYRSYK